MQALYCAYFSEHAHVRAAARAREASKLVAQQCNAPTGAGAGSKVCTRAQQSQILRRSRVQPGEGAEATAEKITTRSTLNKSVRRRRRRRQRRRWR